MSKEEIIELLAIADRYEVQEVKMSEPSSLSLSFSLRRLHYTQHVNSNSLIESITQTSSLSLLLPINSVPDS